MKVYARENYANKVNKWYMDFLFGAIGATISQLSKNNLNPSNFAVFLKPRHTHNLNCHL